MKLSLVFVLALVALMGCSTVGTGTAPSAYTANPPPAGVVPEIVPVWIDKQFTAEHRAAIHDAFSQWNTALNGYENFTIVSDAFDMEPSTLDQVVSTGQGLIVLRRSTHDDIMVLLPDGVLGWVDTDMQSEAHVLNLVEDAIGNRDLVSIAMHEIGHTLRLPHLPVKHTLMYPSYRYGSPCVDQFTVQTLATVRGWEWHALNFCRRPL